MATWTLFTKALGAKDVTGADAASIGVTQDANLALSTRGPLDGIGQQSEQVRERINGLALRLDDLKSLAEEFGQIVQPVADFVLQHAKTQSKLLETEALLARERELSAATRAELNDLHVTAARTFGDFSAASAELRAHQEIVREQEAQLTQIRLRHDDQAATIDNLERQIASETERARALSDENQVLRHEIDGLDQFKSRADGELADAREQQSIANAEILRLQQLAEGLSQRLSGLKGQILDLEPQIQAGRQEIALLQTKLSTEQLARQKAEVNREAERSSQEAEIASLSIRIEGLNAHVGSTEKMLVNLKDQLRDKTEALRVSEKALKEAAADRIVADRRIEAIQETVTRQLGQMAELSRANADHKDRGEMLTKALSAKEAMIEGSQRKVANLTGRIDQISARFEQERAGFEAANRRLIEELQAEKAERSLAQGALDIARNSRSKLLTQFTALKRQSLGGARGVDLGPDDETGGSAEPHDNVRVFKSGDRNE